MSIVTKDDLQKHLEKLPTNQYLNLEVIDVDEGYVMLKMPFNPTFTNSWTNTHGGAILTISDITFYLANTTLNGIDLSGRTVTAEQKTNFLRPTRRTDLYSEGKIIKNGRQNIFGEVLITNPDKKLIAHSTITYNKILLDN